MVKGLSRKVIIVKSPDPKIFEQAIFIVRDDFLASGGVGKKELLQQANRAANGFVNETYGQSRYIKYQPLIYSLLGAGAIILIWALTHLI